MSEQNNDSGPQNNLNSDIEQSTSSGVTTGIKENDSHGTNGEGFDDTELNDKMVEDVNPSEDTKTPNDLTQQVKPQHPRKNNRGMRRQLRGNMNKIHNVPLHPLFPAGIPLQENFDLRTVLGKSAAGDASAWWHQGQYVKYPAAKKPRTNDIFGMNLRKKKNQNANDNKHDEPLEDITNPLKLAIVPTDYPKTLLSEDDSFEIQSKIIDKILQVLEEEVTPTFWNCFLRNGSILIYCTDDKTKDWLLNEMQDLTLENEISLKIGLAKDILQTTKITFSIPKQINLEQDKIMKLLKSQNNGLRTELWLVLECKDDDKGRCINVAIDEDSFKVIKTTNYKAHLGLGVIRFTNAQHFNITTYNAA